MIVKRSLQKQYFTSINYFLITIIKDFSLRNFNIQLVKYQKRKRKKSNGLWAGLFRSVSHAGIYRHTTRIGLRWYGFKFLNLQCESLMTSQKKVNLNILTVALVFKETEDKFSCLLLKSGNYLVRDGYGVTKSLMESNKIIGASFSLVTRIEAQSFIWKEHVYPKIKNFSWRLLHNVVPYKRKFIQNKAYH